MATTDTNQPFVRHYAAPGIDSNLEEFGIRSSGAGLHPETVTLKSAPYDWGGINPTAHYDVSELVNGYLETKAPSADRIRVRVRGIDPFGGFFPGKHPNVNYKAGGVADTNTGLSSMIAGGPGQASSLVRVGKVLPTQGMKLPVLPAEARRGGAMKMPAGGSTTGEAPAPFTPKVAGFPGIFGFIKQGG